MDDEQRENEGDLVIAAQFATPEAINFMARFGRGLICLPMAQALINNPDLLILDEPTSGLDPIGRMKVLIVVYPKFDAADEWFD